MLTKEVIIEALTKLSDELARRGIIGEINIVGGTAMVLAFSARLSTKDVDAIFEPASEVRAAAARVAGELGLAEDWLNDSAKGFLSPQADFTKAAGIELPSLRILVPTAEYMLAMKVLASRVATGADDTDMRDILFLIRKLELRNTDDVMRIVERYYDPSRIPPRSFYVVREIIEELHS